jgi:carbohydrate-selective porin OprB
MHSPQLLVLIPEKAIELNYNIVTNNFNFQPCVQYMMNIAGGKDYNSNQVAFMLRITSHQGLFY